MKDDYASNTRLFGSGKDVIKVPMNFYAREDDGQSLVDRVLKMRAERLARELKQANEVLACITAGTKKISQRRSR